MDVMMLYGIKQKIQTGQWEWDRNLDCKISLSYMYV